MGALKPHAKTLLPYFDRPNGRFVEIGARDGLKESFTPYLEKARGWSGILIEPWPHLYRKCRKQRKSSLCLNVAAVDRHLQDSYIEVAGLPPKASIRRTLAQEERERAQGRPIQAPIPGKPKSKHIHYISTNSLTGILDRANFREHFELMIFNLIGYEDKALEGMDFARHKPTFIMIRANEKVQALPNLPPYYQRVATSKHDRMSSIHLFRFADFGKN